MPPEGSQRHERDGTFAVDYLTTADSEHKAPHTTDARAARRRGRPGLLGFAGGPPRRQSLVILSGAKDRSLRTAADFFRQRQFTFSSPLDSHARR